MPFRPATRPSKQAGMTLEQRALEELARRRVRAVGRCGECGERVERDEQWLRLGAEVFHSGCADDGFVTAPVEDPRSFSIG